MKKNICINYWETTFEELSKIEKNLLLQAKEACQEAYTPYSHFNVGVVALLDNGNIIKGCNVENASYPIGLCAERNLLGHLQQYYNHNIIQTIAISYHTSLHHIVQPISPCGMCRQALVEFEIKQQKLIPLLLGSMDNRVIKINSCKDLLPFCFTNQYLQ